MSALDTNRRSELNVAACHSGFERRVAAALDKHPDVDAWARNFRLDWTVPYEIGGVWHRYVPDFVVRLFGGHHSHDAVHLMLECKGAPDEVSKAKHRYVWDWWIPAVANSPETPPALRRWTFAELTDTDVPASELDKAIEQASWVTPPPPEPPPNRRSCRDGVVGPGRSTDGTGPEDRQLPVRLGETVEPADRADRAAHGRRRQGSPAVHPTGRERDDEPVLAWSRDALPQSYEAHPLYVREKIHPGAFVQSLKAGKAQTTLFDDFNGLPSPDAAYEWYEHAGNWQNRLIHGESARVMASLAERERLSGRVQMIFFDPPYGIGFKSNFQVSTRNRETAEGRKGLPCDTRTIRAFRDTYDRGIHSYLDQMLEKLTLCRELLTESGSIFVQIGDENVHRMAVCARRGVRPREPRSDDPVRDQRLLLGEDGCRALRTSCSGMAGTRREVKYNQLYEPLTRAREDRTHERGLRDGGDCRDGSTTFSLTREEEAGSGNSSPRRSPPLSTDAACIAGHDRPLGGQSRITGVAMIGPCPSWRAMASVDGWAWTASQKLGRLDAAGVRSRCSAGKRYENEVPGRENPQRVVEADVGLRQALRRADRRQRDRALPAHVHRSRVTWSSIRRAVAPRQQSQLRRGGDAGSPATPPRSRWPSPASASPPPRSTTGHSPTPPTARLV